MLNVDLSLSAVDIEVSGRKITLEYFRIHTDNQLEQLTKTEIINELIRIDEYSILLGDNKNQMRKKLLSHQRKRFPQFWADGYCRWVLLTMGTC